MAASPATDRAFKALADGTRRTVLVHLAVGELAAGEIGARFQISGPSISRHLSVLKAAGLVRERREGNRVLYASEPAWLRACVEGYLGAADALGPPGEAPAPAKKKHKDGHKPAKHKAKARGPRDSTDGGAKYPGEADGPGPRPLTATARERGSPAPPPPAPDP